MEQFIWGVITGVTLTIFLFFITADEVRGAEVSIERIYWQPNAGGREVALYFNGGMAKGDIQKLGDTLRAAQRKGKTVKALWLDSWGGDGDTGIIIADWTRRRDLDVFVDNQCLSACAFTALVALGNGRLVITDDAEIGVHQATDMSTGNADPGWTQMAARVLRRYGAPREPLDIMCRQPPGGLHMFSKLTLTAWGAWVVEQPFTWSWW